MSFFAWDTISDILLLIGGIILVVIAVVALVQFLQFLINQLEV